jgi:hypothetical protein
MAATCRGQNNAGFPHAARRPGNADQLANELAHCHNQVFVVLCTYGWRFGAIYRCATAIRHRSTVRVESQAAAVQAVIFPLRQGRSIMLLWLYLNSGRLRMVTQRDF